MKPDAESIIVAANIRSTPDLDPHSMLTVISPAKSLDFDTPPHTRKTSTPEFLTEARALVEDARALSPEDIRELMGVSESLAELNHRRFMNWAPPFSLENAKQAVLAFQGDVYQGLDAASLSASRVLGWVRNGSLTVIVKGSGKAGVSCPGKESCRAVLGANKRGLQACLSSAH